jgi:hypothetical protein
MIEFYTSCYFNFQVCYSLAKIALEGCIIGLNNQEVHFYL